MKLPTTRPGIDQGPVSIRF